MDEANAYKRGVAAAELAEHARRLDRINGSIEKTANSLDELRDEVTTLKTKLALYSGIGSLVGGGVVALIVGVAARAGGA
jgi:hypothetical protein